MILPYRQIQVPPLLLLILIVHNNSIIDMLVHWGGSLLLHLKILDIRWGEGSLLGSSVLIGSGLLALFHSVEGISSVGGCYVVLLEVAAI